MEPYGRNLFVGCVFRATFSLFGPTVNDDDGVFVRVLSQRAPSVPVGGIVCFCFFSYSQTLMLTYRDTVGVMHAPTKTAIIHGNNVEARAHDGGKSWEQNK